jgi:pSer/pThr/pTyr-binding forkhead associated (FHA) protein
MEVSQPSQGAAPEPDALVVQNGRLSGTRRELASPMTLLGREACCDVRLNIDGINPLHCVIVQLPDRYVLRDLGSDAGTFVNHERVSTCPLANGDVIGVGPFVFRVELPPSVLERDSASLAAERDALRIQAAAVAAQQAQLTDEETLVNQRRDALEKREQQIAEHLEERQRRLLELREEIKQQRAVLENDREHFEEKRTTLQAELGKARQLADRERHRCADARKRFKHRWLRYTAEKQSSLHQRDLRLTADQLKLQKDFEALQRDHAHFAELRLRLNGEMEVSRRELKEAWHELALAQQRWEETLNAEHRKRNLHLRLLESRETAVVDGERTLAADRKHWQEARTRLLKEVEGLENRVRNQRYQLQELNPPRPTTSVEVASPLLPAPPRVGLTGAVHELPELPAFVQRMAGHLADQRWLLLEQWTRFLQIEEAWRQDQTALVAEAEAWERRLLEREEELGSRERALEACEADLRRRQDLIGKTRADQESWHARLTLRETHWEGEKCTHLTSAQMREETAAALIEQLEAVRRRRHERRRKEIEDLRQLRSQCEAVRQEYLALLHQFQQRQQDLANEQRALTARIGATEQYREELVNQSANSPAAEKRLEKLQRRISSRIEAAERKLTGQRHAILAETRRLEERARQLQEREAELTTLQEQLTGRLAQWEQEQIDHGKAELPRERELRILRTQHEHDARQVAALREEVERMARLLLGEGAESLDVRAA